MNDKALGEKLLSFLKLLTENMKNDLTRRRLSHPVVGRADVNTSLVPVHVLDGQNLRGEFLFA